MVEYTVDGNQYKVVGPKFLSAISNTISTPLGSIVSDVKMDNFEDGEIPQVLRYKIYRNSFISLTKSPLMERFSIGGKVTVYYDPKKPKHSYVERPLKPGRYAWLTKMCCLSPCFYDDCLGILYRVHSSKSCELIVSYRLLKSMKSISLLFL